MGSVRPWLFERRPELKLTGEQYRELLDGIDSPASGYAALAVAINCGAAETETAYEARLQREREARRRRSVAP